MKKEKLKRKFSLILPYQSYQKLKTDSEVNDCSVGRMVRSIIEKHYALIGDINMEELVNRNGQVKSVGSNHTEDQWYAVDSVEAHEARDIDLEYLNKYFDHKAFIEDLPDGVYMTVVEKAWIKTSEGIPVVYWQLNIIKGDWHKGDRLLVKHYLIDDEKYIQAFMDDVKACDVDLRCSPIIKDPDFWNQLIGKYIYLTRNTKSDGTVVFQFSA